MNLLLKEYLISGDVSEAEHCLRDLEVPHFHHELVYEVSTAFYLFKSSEVKQSRRFIFFYLFFTLNRIEIKICKRSLFLKWFLSLVSSQVNWRATLGRKKKNWSVTVISAFCQGHCVFGSDCLLFAVHVFAKLTSNQSNQNVSLCKYKQITGYQISNVHTVDKLSFGWQVFLFHIRQSANRCTLSARVAAVIILLPCVTLWVPAIFCTMLCS